MGSAAGSRGRLYEASAKRDRRLLELLIRIRATDPLIYEAAVLLLSRGVDEK